MIVEVLFLMLGAVHFMLKNKGMTLIEVCWHLVFLLLLS